MEIFNHIENYYETDAHNWVQKLPLKDNKVVCIDCGIVRPISEISIGVRCSVKRYCILSPDCGV